MKLLRRVCGNSVQPSRRVKDGFEIIAYDGMMEWSDYINTTISLDEQVWPRSVILPSKNEMKIVKVHFPFNFKLGEHFWVLFMPALSWINGWTEYPEEIDKSAIVGCKFKNFIDQNQKSAWIRIKITDVIPLSSICDRFSDVQCDTYLEQLKSKKGVQVMELENWILYEWSEQSDFGLWALVHKHPSGSSHMILYCEWNHHANNVYCGNIKLDN